MTGVFVFNVTEELFQSCHVFAVGMDKVSGSLYAKRNNQRNPETRIRQSRESKIGEQAAAEYLRHIYKGKQEVKGPDYRVLPPNEKSWAHDLYIGNNGVACKCCNTYTANRYGLGWIFENTDTLHRRPQGVGFIGCWYDPYSETVYVLPVVKAEEPLKYLTLPDEPYLRDSKKVARYRDMYGKVERWGDLPEDWRNLKPTPVIKLPPPSINIPVDVP